MGFILDKILWEKVMEDEVINTDTTSEYVDVTFAEDGFLFNITWDDGSNVDFILTLEISGDGINWVEYPNSEQQILGDSGVHLYDVIESNVNYARIKLVPSTGSGTFNITYSAKRRH